MNYLVIVVAFDGAGDLNGCRVYSIRFNTKQAAELATEWLNSLDEIQVARFYIDPREP